MEAGLLYNLECIALLFSFISSFYYLNQNAAFAVTVSMGLVYMKMEISSGKKLSLPALCVLLLTAHALQRIIAFAVGRLATVRSRPRSSQMLGIMSLVITFLVGLILRGRSGQKAITIEAMGTIFIGTFTVLAILVKGTLQRYGTNNKVQDRQLALVTLTLPLLPLLVVGDVVALIEGMVTTSGVLILLPLAARFAMAGSMHQLRSKPRSKIWASFAVARWLVGSYYVVSMTCFTVPTATRTLHPMGVLVVGFAIVDALEQGLSWM